MATNSIADIRRRMKDVQRGFDSMREAESREISLSFISNAPPPAATATTPGPSAAAPPGAAADANVIHSSMHATSQLRASRAGSSRQTGPGVPVDRAAAVASAKPAATRRKRVVVHRVITAPGAILNSQRHTCLNSQKLGRRGFCPACNGYVSDAHVRYLRFLDEPVASRPTHYIVRADDQPYDDHPHGWSDFAG